MGRGGHRQFGCDLVDPNEQRNGGERQGRQCGCIRGRGRGGIANSGAISSLINTNAETVQGGRNWDLRRRWSRRRQLRHDIDRAHEQRNGHGRRRGRCAHVRGACRRSGAGIANSGSISTLTNTGMVRGGIVKTQALRGQRRGGRSRHPQLGRDLSVHEHRTGGGRPVGGSVLGARAGRASTTPGRSPA